MKSIDSICESFEGSFPNKSYIGITNKGERKLLCYDTKAFTGCKYAYLYAYVVDDIAVAIAACAYPIKLSKERE